MKCSGNIQMRLKLLNSEKILSTIFTSLWKIDLYPNYVLIYVLWSLRYMMNSCQAWYRGWAQPMRDDVTIARFFLYFLIVGAYTDRDPWLYMNDGKIYDRLAQNFSIILHSVGTKISQCVCHNGLAHLNAELFSVDMWQIKALGSQA